MKVGNVTRMKIVVGAVLASIAPHVSAISNTGKIPILLYHTWLQSGCDHPTNALVALESDLTALKNAGFEVVPLYWVAEWVRGDRDGSTLPAKPIAITLDDGNDADFVSADYGGCGTSRSAYSVLSNYRTANNLPYYYAHATSFVIASTIARGYIAGNAANSNWWGSAQATSMIEVQNHSADHDSSAITSQVWDPFLFAYLTAGGYDGGVWAGQNSFDRIDTYTEADVEVRKAAAYISGITGAWPDLFAYPDGKASSYIKGTYFPNYWSSHQTYAAFCLGSTYATRNSDPYCIPRFSHNADWNSSSSLVSNILSGAP